MLPGSSGGSAPLAVEVDHGPEGAGGQAQPAVIAALDVEQRRLIGVDAQDGVHFAHRCRLAGVAYLAAQVVYLQPDLAGHSHDFPF